ncbi:hypothetical protein [Methylocystis suflitae]|uniref:hypothetical protein n=1 Tax=Methylocystis suflitae TaxID=2951405 RepID=UPI00210950A4|nr:hypothetical protein [Methylocystis suflitae]MCQ4189940.1 hypothetical protein [Methylocystis suflitae]
MQHEGDFSFTISFTRGAGNPRRVFDAASALIDAFQSFDRAVLPSLDAKIESHLVLEDVSAGSMRVKLASMLRSIDDDALRSGDWKRIAGDFAVKAKRSAIEFLEKEDDAPERLEALKEQIKECAATTDVRHLPDYPPVHEGRLIASLDKIQKAKAELEIGDSLTIELGKDEYSVDISSTWLPSETLNKTPSEPIEKENVVEVSLTIRKPDLIKNTMWQFSHGKTTVNAAIKDEEWLRRLHARDIGIFAGDALQCTVRMVYSYDEKGELIDTRAEIVKVHGIIAGHVQDDLPL